MSNKPKIMAIGANLTELQSRLFNRLMKAFDHDVFVADCYVAVYGNDQAPKWGVPPPPPLTNRDKQQKLGPLIARINSHIHPYHIEPGRTKQTYRLCRKGK